MKPFNTISVIIQDIFDIIIPSAFISSTLTFPLRFFLPKCIDICIYYLPHIPLALSKSTWSFICIFLFQCVFIPIAQQPHIGPRTPHYRGFTITLRHTTVGRTPLDEWPVRHTPLPHRTQQSQETDTHAPDGIRSRNTSKRAAVDPCLRPRSHWDRSSPCYVIKLWLKCSKKLLPSPSMSKLWSSVQ